MQVKRANVRDGISVTGRTRKIVAVLIGISVLISLCGCEKGTEPEVAAEWGPVQVTLSDFERMYFAQWQTTHEPDSPLLREGFARLMIEQQLVADSALTLGLISERDIGSVLERETDYFLRRRYLEKTIKDTLTEISDSELSKALRRTRIRLRVRQLFALTEDSIRVLQLRLQKGERFEDVARRTIPDPQIASREGDLGWVGWGDTDLPVEEVLYTLKPGEVSGPVQSLMGWHIFRIDSVETTFDFQASDDPFYDKEIRLRLFNRKLQMAAAYHYRELVWSKPLAVRVSLFRTLWDLIEPELPGSVKEQALFGYDGIEKKFPQDLKNEALAEVDEKPFTVAEFIRSIPDLPRELLRPNLKMAVEVAVRDRIVKEEALKQGLDRDPVVMEKVNRSKIKFFYQQAIAVLDSIENRKVDLSDYYETHRERYIDFVESEVEEILVGDRRLAIDLARRVSSGEDFSTLVKSYSLHSETAEHGGRTGWISSKSGPVGARAATLLPGQIFAPVETQEGFRVIRVIQQRKHYLDFERAKELVVQDANRNYYEVLHRKLLPVNYAPGQVKLYPEVLNRAFTDQGKTRF